MPETRNRNIRIPDRLWVLVQEKAKREYTNVTAVIVRLLYEWVREDYPEAAEKPPAKKTAAKKAPAKKPTTRGKR